MANMKTFAEKLSYYRKLAGLNQSELAEKVGITTAQISRYETNKSNPRPNTIAAIADALGIDTSKLTTFETNKKTSENYDFSKGPVKNNTSLMVYLSKDIENSISFSDNFFSYEENELISEIKKLLIKYVRKNQTIRHEEIEELIKTLQLSSIQLIFLPNHMKTIHGGNTFESIENDILIESVGGKKKN